MLDNIYQWSCSVISNGDTVPLKGEKKGDVEFWELVRPKNVFFFLILERRNTAMHARFLLGAFRPLISRSDLHFKFWLL